MTKIWRIKTCRVLVSLLAVALLVLLATTVSTNASAQETKLPFVRVEDKTVHRGQTFELNVYLEENPGLVAMLLEIKYDKSVMSLIGVKRGDALVTHTFTTTNTETEMGFLVDPFRLLWDGTTQDKTTGCLLP